MAHCTQARHLRRELDKKLAAASARASQVWSGSVMTRNLKRAEDLPGTPAKGLRAAMITKIESRIAAGFNGFGLREDLRHLRAGETVQLYRSEVPRHWLPQEDYWRLYELRGERLVGVPTNDRSGPPEWTVP